MSEGKVYLIGAGPGDPGLLTVKGLRHLQEADSIVYDRLVSIGLLAYCKPGAKLIYVGKAPYRHTLDQQGINRLLVAEASKGRVVVRLKGGDPFVFGRGGEEILALRQAGIDFEVVPGITSALAAPAYGGIPVTHRGSASSFTVVTGHEDPTRTDSAINWGSLAAQEGTLIFLMGVERIAEIAAALLQTGKDGGTPAAVIQWGTCSRQKVATGTLDTIKTIAHEAGLTSPSVIVVGEVVRLRDQLKWFEDKPLFGLRILVTRTREQAGVLAGKLRGWGGEVVEFPTIAVKPPEDFTTFDYALRQLGKYGWLFFTSVHGVAFFFQRLRHLKIDIRSLGAARICAIGPQTKEALEERGLTVEYQPGEYRAEAFVEGLKGRLHPGQRALLPRSHLARPYLAKQLRSLGVAVDEIVAYRTVSPEGSAEQIREMIKNKEIDVITFTSSSTITNFLKILAVEEPHKLLHGIFCACIGPVTAETAAAAGLKVDVTAADYTIEGLVQVLVRHFLNKQDLKNEQSDKGRVSP
ncbi:MAG: uroporphyrinogen-III C-methyltransferase [Desulfitobacteriaceae bacterium]|nr:uroporphyrinogen-III C-methyltransferase [Clostridia bacterium]MDD4345480.1 uroporphyrinogen-III C-methyltransferase [Desulfitobacteriaceae bacterium]MDD4400625.1 uroporphyrinogen-III C-methyltransferase [Desulfitobacteriaceae bacterium]